MKEKHWDNPQEQVIVLRSFLWVHEQSKLFFSLKPVTGLSPPAYYCYKLRLSTGIRSHHHYSITESKLLIYIDDKIYWVKELPFMRKYDLIIIQLTNTADDLDYINYIGEELPVTRIPYSIHS